MKSKIYAIDVQVEGEWKEWDGIDYVEAAPKDNAEMHYQLRLLKSHGYKARRRCVGEADFVFLTAKGNIVRHPRVL